MVVISGVDAMRAVTCRREMRVKGMSIAMVYL
jgi:hypothetical protein